MAMVIDHLYSNFYHKIAGKSISLWIPEYLQECRQCIFEKLEEVQEQFTQNISIQFDQFRIFGFLDDTGFETCRPSPSSETSNTSININDSDNQNSDNQRSFYSGYFRHHGLKAQTIILPNGMITGVFITSLRHNDGGVLNMSGVSDNLTRLLRNHPIPPINHLPAVYCDGIFAPKNCIVPRYVSPNPFQKLINRYMSPLRVYIENIYADVKNVWRIFQTKGKFKILQKGRLVRKAFTIIFFVHNCYSCLNENRADYFNMRCPTLGEYLPLDEDLVQAPEMDLD